MSFQVRGLSRRTWVKGILAGMGLVFILAGVGAFVVYANADDAYSWSTSQSATVDCYGNGTASFKNTEPNGAQYSMDVTVGGVTQTVPSGQTKYWTFVGEKEGNKIVFSLKWTDGRAGVDSRTVTVHLPGNCGTTTTTSTTTTSTTTSTTVPSTTTSTSTTIPSTTTTRPSTTTTTGVTTSTTTSTSTTQPTTSSTTSNTTPKDSSTTASTISTTTSTVVIGTAITELPTTGANDLRLLGAALFLFGLGVYVLMMSRNNQKKEK